MEWYKLLSPFLAQCVSPVRLISSKCSQHNNCPFNHNITVYIPHVETQVNIVMMLWLFTHQECTLLSDCLQVVALLLSSEQQ